MAPEHLALEVHSAPRILVVRRDNIGDLVCTTPLFEALRVRLPDAWLGALVNTYNAEVLARNPAISAVFAYEKLKHREGSLFSNLVARMRLSRELRARRLDYVLVPAPTPRALGLAARLNARRVIAGEASGADGRHEVERTFSLGRSLGVQAEPGPLRVYPNPDVCARLAMQLGTGPFVAVHISARRAAQRWPLERFVELIAELRRQCRVLLLWAPGAENDPRHPGDDLAAKRIASMTNAIAVPTPNLQTLIAVLSLADGVICPDGGAMHLAAALGKPVVALFGDSSAERWRPWRVSHHVVQPASRNLRDLPVAPVVEACAAIISRPCLSTAQ